MNPETTAHGFPCKGVPQDHLRPQPQSGTYTPEQAAWMRANKPLCYTGDIRKDLPHLPAKLRVAG